MFKNYLFKNRSFRLYFVIDEQRKESTYNLVFKKVRFFGKFTRRTDYTHLLCLYIGLFQLYLKSGFRDFRGYDDVSIFWSSSFPKSIKQRFRKQFPNASFYNAV